MRKQPVYDKTKLCEHCHEPFRQMFARHVFCDACAPSGKFSKFIRKYSVGKREWDAMLARQSGGCAICHKELDLGRDTHVDHDHKTGKARGLLCNRCNTKVGVLEDSTFVTKALKYLGQCSIDSEQVTIVAA